MRTLIADTRGGAGPVTGGCLAVLLAALAGGVPAQTLPPAWVLPRYTATEPETRSLTLLDHYHYVERRYEPGYTIAVPVPAGEERFTTPEQAMISRISAMMRGDYATWFEAWDPASREFVRAKNAQSGDSPEVWVERWNDRLRFMRFRLVRRIETGPYVVITYNLVTPSGEDATGGLELPSVFRRDDEGRWWATQDLHEDALVALSPWVSGQSMVEVQVPW